MIHVFTFLQKSRGGYRFCNQWAYQNIREISRWAAAPKNEREKVKRVSIASIFAKCNGSVKMILQVNLIVAHLPSAHSCSISSRGYWLANWKDYLAILFPGHLRSKSTDCYLAGVNLLLVIQAY